MCKVEKIITVSAVRFSYYDRDTQELYLLRDQDGNRIIYRSKTGLVFKFKPCNVNGHRINDQQIFINEGDTITLSATIKYHTEYDGEKQTAIARPTITSVEYRG